LTPFPERIVWVYGEWQKCYDEIRVLYPHIEFIENWQDWIYDSFNKDTRNLLVLDDQMSEMKDNETLSKLFTKGSHHRNLTVMFLMQNSFKQGKAIRDCVTNAQYRVYFDNPADELQTMTEA
jgi:hypothetical protein